MSEDNKMIVPFGTTIVCRRCKVTLKHGDVVFNDGAGFLYCSKHNPKKRAGPSETKETGGRG